MGRKALGKRKVTWTLYPSTYDKVKALAEAQGRTASDVVEEILLKAIPAQETGAGMTSWEGFIGEPARNFTGAEKQLFPVVYQAFLIRDVTALQIFEGFKELRMVIGAELTRRGFNPFVVADPYTLCWCSYLSSNKDAAKVWAYTLACMHCKLSRTVTFKDWTETFSKGVPSREEFEPAELAFIDNRSNWPIPGAAN